MRRIAAVIVFVLISASAFGQSLRSDKHLVKIDVNGRQYTVQVFDAATRAHVADLKIVARGNGRADGEPVAGTTRYKVHIEPHGESLLIAFTAADGDEIVDSMRGGFTAGVKSNPRARNAVR